MNNLVDTRTLNNKVTNNSNKELQEEVYNFLESINTAAGQKEKTKQVNKNKQLDVIPEDKEKKTLNVAKGLTDNILNDYEYKDKARKGLLHLLNKLSGGSFCPEIKNYFRELQDNRRKEKSLNSKKENKIKSESNHKNLRRQNFLTKSVLNRGKTIDNETIKDEEFFKLNFLSGSKDKGTLTVMNNIATKQLTFKKRNKKLKKGNKESNTEEMKLGKKYQMDLTEKELNLFYSERELDKSDVESNVPPIIFKSRGVSRKKSRNNSKIKNLKTKIQSRLQNNAQLIAEKSQKLIKNNIKDDVNVTEGVNNNYVQNKTKIFNSNERSNKYFRDQKSRKIDEHAEST